MISYKFSKFTFWYPMIPNQKTALERRNYMDSLGLKKKSKSPDILCENVIDKKNKTSKWKHKDFIYSK